ncbi:serine hydrolase domain-containing protein [Micromonospora narathiwatensis]|uniref:CubicO group peptidase, beta-lactamase class C family n=1 Tax=Micromonospora narathiwatensis TaxID=299146 RepID=A0A1A8ZBP0_9ACTN|nr:serine hydrolase domain-containing protein [Micromonospora narathiwatensis]SBT41281.1 CubicO group peptidase, beta-lactamase class C family [Micromonospora narathiwatensis]
MPEIEGFSGVVTLTRAGRPVTSVTGGGCTPTTPFQIASVSKNFASTLTMMLVEEGLLDLHEPLDHWLPEAPRSWHALSLHHLLSNTSGIGHWTDVPGMDPFVPATRDERLELVLRAPLQSEPGRQFRYSSPAFILVGVVAERATGSPYGKLLAERILQPLGLTRTASGIRPPDAAPGHRAGKPVEPWDVASMIGSGDLCSTAEDLVAYARAVEDGGLVSPASLALMRTRHSTFIEPDRTPDGRLEVTGYGYGHYVGTFDGRPAALHTGDNPGYRSLVGWLPDGVGIVALSNEDSVRWEDVLARVL